MTTNFDLNQSLFDVVFWCRPHPRKPKQQRWEGQYGSMLCLLHPESARPTHPGERWIIHPVHVLNADPQRVVVQVMLECKLYVACEEVILSFKQETYEGRPQWERRVVENGTSITYVPDRLGPQPTTSDTRWKGAKGAVIAHNEDYTQIVVAVVLREEVVSERTRQRRERRVAA